MIRIINPIENNLRQRSFIEWGDSCFSGDGKRNDFGAGSQRFLCEPFRVMRVDRFMPPNTIH